MTIKRKSHKVVGQGHGAHDQSWDELDGEIWGPAPARQLYEHLGAETWDSVSPYFQPDELACNGTGVLLVYVPMVKAYNTLRAEGLLTAHSPNRNGHSFYRSPQHNKSVGGAKRSRHMFSATDVGRRFIPDVPAMLTRAVELGFNGFGNYPSFIHMDFRARPGLWGAKGKSAKNFPNW